MKLRFFRLQSGFTYVEAILYVAIISIILTALIPFTWNIVEGGTKSATQQEVSSQARVISERIIYEIRNAVDITSVTVPTLTLCENSANCSLAANQTVVTFTGSTITINQANAGAVTLNSTNVKVTGSFTNNSSGSSTKNVTFTLTVTENTGSTRSEYTGSETISSSAEVRNL
ncbi:MAG: type II secretion system protein [Patescibacteria group bacterium]|nr:type II secretion system protein [Patescibacteria group bacterium]MDE2590458.1 type II secretion system protein [Patescibacteria group bacterium]